MKLVAKLALLPITVTLLVASEIKTNFIVEKLERPFKFNSKAIAQIVQDYIPPITNKKISRTKGAGSRGCNQPNNTYLQLLTPNDHTPTTLSTHPTFFWYISATSLPVRFTLIEPGVAKPVMDRKFLVTRPGIVGLKLPSDLPGLALNKEYRWTVAIICNEERQSANTYAYSWINRVDISPKLNSMVSVSIKPQERSLIYARHGIWYEALLNSIVSYESNLQNKISSSYLSLLLEQIGIVSLTNQQLQHGNILSIKPVLKHSNE